MSINHSFVSPRDTDEEHEMHSKIDNIEITSHDKADKVIKELFESLLNRYQIGSETSLRGSDFVIDCFSLLHYKCHKINFKCGGSYIHFPH